MQILISDVRLSFESIFKPQSYQGGPLHYGASFLFAIDHPAHKQITEAIEAVAQEEWAAEAHSVLKALYATDKICLRNGDNKPDWDDYPGQYYVRASNSLRPLVLDRLRSPLTAADGRPYAGCYVNASIDIWAQSNNFGKRINAGLRGVQFLRDGEPFVGGGIASEDEFEEVHEDTDAATTAIPSWM